MAKKKPAEQPAGGELVPQRRQMLEARANPLLREQIRAEVDLTTCKAPSIHKRPLATNRRELRDMRRAKNAAEAVGAIDHETEVYGFTKGQFSFIDLIRHCLNTTGPADVQLFTWTCAGNDITAALDLCSSGLIRSSRWLVDLSFNRRAPALAHRIRQTFGDDAIRVSKNHAKFALLSNDAWQIVIRTSMNLNYNPRFENFQLAHDPELWHFHNELMNEIWQKQKRSDQDLLRPYDIHRQFAGEL